MPEGLGLTLTLNPKASSQETFAPLIQAGAKQEGGSCLSTCAFAAA